MSGQSVHLMPTTFNTVAGPGKVIFDPAILKASICCKEKCFY